MKECPVCHRRYDDSLKFCTKDGYQLETIENEPTGAIPQKVEAETAVEKPLWKKVLKIVLLSLVGIAVVLAALYNYYTNAATYLRTEPSNLCVPKNHGTFDVDIDFDGYVWDVNYHSDWIQILKRKKSISLIIARNTTGRVREGSVTIKSGKHLAQVTIVQNAVATVMRTEETALQFDKDGGYQTVTVETDGCDIDIENPDWIDASCEDGKLEVNCNSNSEEYRKGQIVLKEDDLRCSISVTQGGICNVCHGKGSISCSLCGGTGGYGYGMFFCQCTWCGGSGSHTCSSCNGTGERN